MTLFSIDCATCHAKLNVRDPALIGQILACPKCGSMVMIEAPEGFEPPSDETDDQPEGESTADSTESGSSESAEARRHYDSRADTKPMAVPQAEELGSAPTRPMPPSTDWSSDESRQMRRLLVLSGGGVGAVVLAVALCGFWMARGRQTAGASEENPNETVQADEPISEAPTETVQNEIDDTASNETNPNENGNSDDAQGDKSDVNSEENTVPEDPPKPENKNDAASSDDMNPVETPTEDTPPTPESVGDDANTQDAPPGFETKGDNQDPDAEAVAKTLERLEKLLDPTAGDDEGERPKRIEVERQPPVELADKPAARNVDVGVQLRRPVLSMQIEEAPLVEFVRFISEMSTIPITLDPVALQARGLRANTPVDVNLEQTTVEGILRAAVEPLGLDLEQRPGHLRIGLSEESEPKELDISDLANENPQQLERLSTWVTNLIHPRTWSNAGGQGGLSVEGQAFRVEQTARVRYQVRRLLERLRRARDLQLKYDLPESELQLESNGATDFLDQPVSANHRIPTYFTDILSELGRAADVDILVDWESAAQAGWNPEGKVRLRVEDRPLSETLDALLQSMELDYHIAGERLVVITNNRVRYVYQPLLMHDCEKLMESLGGDEQALAQLMTGKLGRARFQPQGGPIAAFYDPGSKRLIVSAPRADQDRIVKLIRDASE